MAKVKYSVLVEALDKFSTPARKMTTVSGDMAKQLAAGQQRLNDLGKSQVAVQSLQKLEKKLSSTGSQLGVVREQLASSGRALKATTAPTQTLVGQHEKWKTALDKLQRSHRELLTQARTQRSELSKSGLNIRDLGAAYKDLGSQVETANQKMQRLAAREADNRAYLQRRDHAIQRSAHASLIAGGMSRVGHQAMSFVLSPLQEMRQTERAKGGLQSLGVTNTQAILSRGEEMAQTWAGIDTASFTAAAYDIKSGISSLDDQGIADVTAAAAVTAKATKANVGQMTSLFATGHGIFKKQFSGLSSSGFANVFSGQLSKAVQVFKTDGGKMQQAIESMGGGLSASGISMAEQLATLGELQGTSLAGVSGTTLAALERSMGVAQMRFERMGLGVDLLNANGNMRSLPDVLEQLQGTFGNNYTTDVGRRVKEAFGSEEAVKFFKLLWGQQEKLRANTELLRQAGFEGQKFAKAMAKQADDNADSKLTLIEQRWSLLKEKLGRSMIPVIDALAPKLEWATDKLQGLMTESPKLTGYSVAGVAAFGALSVALAPVVTAVGTMSVALVMLRRHANQATRALSRADYASFGAGGGGKRRSGKRMRGAAMKGGATGLAFGALSLGATLMDDELDGDQKTKQIATDVGGAVGGTAGMAAGMAAGAAIGSIIPGFGTVAGMLIGGGLGLAGSHFGSELGASFGDWMADIEPFDEEKYTAPHEQIVAAAARNNVANQNVVQNVTNHFQNVTDPREAGRHVGESIRKASEGVFSPVLLVDTEPVF